MSVTPSAPEPVEADLGALEDLADWHHGEGHDPDAITICRAIAEITALRAETELLRAAVKDVCELMVESCGVYGLHRNGAGAPWEEIRRGGEFENWLRNFDRVVLGPEGE